MLGTGQIVTFPTYDWVNTLKNLLITLGNNPKVENWLILCLTSVKINYFNCWDINNPFIINGFFVFLNYSV
jgi:hypothetical protein